MSKKQWPVKWSGKTWTTSVMGQEAVLTEDELRACYEAVPRGKDAMAAALGVKALSIRKADRALQLLRHEGLIAFGEGRRWVQI